MSFEDGLGSLGSCCFSGDGEALFTAGSEGFVRWSVDDGRATVIDPRDCAFVLAERGTSMVATLDEGGVLRIFDVRYDRPLVDERRADDVLDEDLVAEGVNPLRWRRGEVEIEGDLDAWKVCEHPGGRWVARLQKNKLRVETTTGALVDEVQLPRGAKARALSFDDDDALLIGADKLRVFRWREGKGTEPVAVKSARREHWSTIVFSPRGDRVAFHDTYLGRVDVHDLDTGARLVSLGRFRDRTEDTGSERAWTSPDGKRAVFFAGRGDGQYSNDDVFLWDTQAQRVLRTFYEARIFIPFIISDELIAAILDDDDRVELLAWDHDGAELARVPLPGVEELPDDYSIGARGLEVFVTEGDGGFIVDAKEKTARRVDAPPVWSSEGTRLF
jgi:hypothetical protein